jgi:aldose 1-epimerase
MNFRVKCLDNGLRLDIWSNQNGVQFYTGNFLNVTKENGERYSMHEGFCLETHNYPDAVNKVRALNVYVWSKVILTFSY